MDFDIISVDSSDLGQLLNEQHGLDIVLNTVRPHQIDHRLDVDVPLAINTFDPHHLLAYVHRESAEAEARDPRCEHQQQKNERMPRPL